MEDSAVVLFWKLTFGLRDYEKFCNNLVQMRIDKLTEIMVFGWYLGLKGKGEKIRKKSKTVFYWKIMLS